MKVVLLPGLDGTGDLFQPFLDALSPRVTASVLPLPTDTPQTYECLTEELSSSIRGSSSCVLIAESFSGPIAIKLASEHPLKIAAVVLVASFVTSPLPAIGRCLPWSLVFRLPLPSLAARWSLLGRDAPENLVQALRRAVRAVPPQVLAQRVRQLIRFDLSDELSAVKCPLMYLRPSMDRLVPRRCVDTIRRIRSDLLFQQLDGPHLILQRQPVRAWSAMTDFLNEAPGSAIG